MSPAHSSDQDPPLSHVVAHETGEHLKIGGWHPVEWGCEFLGIAFQFFAAFCFIAAMESPLSPLHHAVPSSNLRLVLIGLFIGAMAAVVAVSPLGRRSGAHLNPAVTIGFWARGSTHLADLAGYLFAQFAGVTAAALLFVWVGGDWAATAGYARTTPRPGLNLWSALGIEIVISFFLVFTVLFMVSSHRTKRWAPVAVTIALAVLIPLGGPPTGASMNPARTFGPDAVTGTFTALWVYLLGPAIGAIAAAAVFPIVGRGRKVLTAKLYHDDRYPSIHAVHRTPPVPGAS